MRTFNESELLEGFIDYYYKAKMLQDNNFSGAKYTESDVDDPLCWNVPIYDCVNRRYAGFSNVPEALWYGSKAPKGDYSRYNHLHELWSIREWLFILLLHRVTGSGASFEKDHGWRNTIIPKLIDFDTVEQMCEFILNYEGPIFTSKGNQPPQFNKSDRANVKPGINYITKVMPNLIDNLSSWMSKSLFPNEIYQTVDYMNEWNIKHSLKRYSFVYTAFAMDVAEYYTTYSSPDSRIYIGSNAKKCLNIILPKAKGKKRFDYENDAISYLCKITGNYSTPMDMEDILCDGVRYFKEYAATEYKNNLINSQMKNNSILKRKLGEEKYYNLIEIEIKS
jgi:hypothetical protein